MEKFELRRRIMVIIIIIIYWNIANQKKQDIHHKQQMEAIQAKDSLQVLYFEHLKECAMINKNEVKVDTNGYFYSAYWKKYK